MNTSEMVKGSKKVEVPAGFEMPSCVFCYQQCGDCRYYENGWNGYCTYHRCRVSSTDPGCSQYS